MTRHQNQGLRAIKVIGALAAALLAAACGNTGSGHVVTLQVTPDDVPGLHTLGGTISGLTRAGLVLANGDSTVSVPAHATAFTLTAPVAYTHAYAVTVAAQPVQQTCSVSGGSGAMPASDVRNVKVRCLDNASGAGANPNALDAKGLVLFLALARSARYARF